MSSAYLLVFHGSLDPRPQVSVAKLAELVAHSMLQVAAGSSVRPRVGTAALEGSSMPLPQQIQKFALSALADGYQHIQILPLFLLPGVHVMEDIPAAVAQAQQVLGQKAQIQLRPHLGAHPGLEKLLAHQLAATKADAHILLAHGSRRPGAKQMIEAMVQRLGAVSAYWAVSPSLAARVEELVAAGHQRIGILPYFLFAGGITAAIGMTTAQLQQQFPSTELLLAQPLAASAELADLIRELIA